MKQLIQNYKTGELRLEEVPIPAIGAGGVLVRNVYSLISAGTEKMKLNLASKSLIGKAKERPDQLKQVVDSVKRDGLVKTYKKTMNRLDTPTPLGYSSSGVVIAVGREVVEFQVGDRVACAGEGYACHAEVVFVPKNLCAKIPEKSAFGVEVSSGEAAFTTLGAIAMQGVRQADGRLGEHVAVVGLGLVGLLAMQILKAAGCSVLGIDIDPRKLQTALELGADAIAAAGSDDVENIVLDFSKGRGADSVIIAAATSSSDPVILAGQILRDRGKVVIVGAVGMDIPRKPFYEKELDLRLSRSYGAGRYDPLYEEKGIDYPIGYVRWTEKRNMEAFLDLLAQGKVNVEKLITHKFRIDDAERAYDVILGKTAEQPIGVLLEYAAEVDAESKVTLVAEEDYRKEKLLSAVPLGLVGAGNFARSVLLPNMRDSNSVVLKGVATGSGINAKHVAQKFGFQYCTTDYREILDDPEVKAVAIATRHNLHARVAIEAMKKNKAVFVEKPLALNEGELVEVIAAWKENEGQLMVGFNRRFAPAVEEVKRFFQKRTQPFTINYRINAGFIPKDHWTQDPDAGGGRIIGEVCHFVDVAHFIAQSRPLKVFAESISANNDALVDNDNISVTIKFSDGSLANIMYLANGDSALPKERIEVFSEGSIAIVDDFKKLQLIRKGKIRTIKNRRQDKGHKKELQMFINALKNGAKMPITFRDSVIATYLTFMVKRSLQMGQPLEIDIKQFGL